MPLGRYQPASGAAAGDAVLDWLDLFRALVNLKITPAGNCNTVLQHHAILHSRAICVVAVLLCGSCT
jgi:hypothetical protein